MIIIVDIIVIMLDGAWGHTNVYAPHEPDMWACPSGYALTYLISPTCSPTCRPHGPHVCLYPALKTMAGDLTIPFSKPHSQTPKSPSFAFNASVLSSNNRVDTKRYGYTIMSGNCHSQIPKSP